MLSLLLSFLIAMAQVLVCPGMACQFRLVDPHGAAAPSTHQAPVGPSLDHALAWMGQAAIEAAFSGVVRVGDGAEQQAPPLTRPC